MPNEAPSSAEIEAAMLKLIAQRGENASACPSEVARALASHTWRELMPQVREAAVRLRGQGLLDISQSGVSVTPDQGLRGPIRIRQRPREAACLPIRESP